MDHAKRMDVKKNNVKQMDANEMEVAKMRSRKRG